MCGHVSNNEHAKSHHITRLNFEFADLIASCNNIQTWYTDTHSGSDNLIISIALQVGGSRSFVNLLTLGS